MGPEFVEREEALTYLEGLCYKSVEGGPVSPGTNRHWAQVEILLLGVLKEKEWMIFQIKATDIVLNSFKGIYLCWISSADQYSHTQLIRLGGNT